MEDKKLELLNPLLSHKLIAWSLLSIAFALTIIDNFFKMNIYIGGWHIVIYLLLLLPLGYMVWTKQTANPHTKWFLPILLVMIVDMFYYNNDMVQFFLPFVFYIMVLVLYITSMHQVHSLYQTLLPRLGLPLRGVHYIKVFVENLFVKNDDREIYARIGMALLITLPFLGVFIGLLFSADSHYGDFIVGLFSFDIDFELRYMLTAPLYFFLYLLLFIYGLSNHKNRVEQGKTTALDMLIVGIFLGMINLLFLTFIMVQIPFLVGGSYLPEGITLAEFAREGFFQLMMVMGLVILILLFIMRRFKGEMMLSILLSGLLIQTIVMGLVSLKKMHLYQSIKGATVLRYYVEWFDYFLIAVLFLGVLFLIRKVVFSKFLDLVALLGVVAFTLIVSLNIESMVASHNIEKFKNDPANLDKDAISSFSIDALSVVKEAQLDINRTIVAYSDDLGGKEIYFRWYEDIGRKNCNSFATYHWGYCSKLKKYGDNK